MVKIIAAALVLLTTLIITTISSNAKGPSTLDAQTFKSDYRITTIHIGSDVSEITSTAFRNLNNLRLITVSEGNPYFASYSGCLYDKELTELVCYPPALAGTYIPDTVVSIRENALHGVPEAIKEQVKTVVEGQAAGNLKESEIPGEHFIHTETGIKWKKADGTVESPNSNMMSLAAAVVDASTIGSMTQPQQLEAAFSFIVNNVTYERRMDEPSGDWVREYASETLSTRKGNCYGYAASFAYVAKGLGYDARVCTGTVKSSLGGRTPHAWTEVKVGNRWYVFDAEMQNAKGTGYYKQTYESYPAGPLEKETSISVSF